MKFRGAGSTRERRSRSVDVIGRPEDATEPEFFDPRVDFPAEELDKLKRLAAKFAAGQIAEEDLFFELEGLRLYWWLSLVDEEFRQMLTNVPRFAESLFNKYWNYFEISGDPLKRVFQAIPAIQLFPSLRKPIQEKFFDPNLEYIRRKIRYLDISDTAERLRGLLVLYPEQRKEWLELLSVQPETVVSDLRIVLQRTDFSFRERASIFSTFLLVFPHLRSEILKILPPQNKWIQDFKKVGHGVTYSPEFAFDLTVIGAESARIDEQGQIQLELKPRSLQRAQRPLPERSTA